MKTLLASLLFAGTLMQASTAKTTITFGTPVPLIEAVLKADLDGVKGELAAGSPPEAADALGRTALHYAAALGYQEILLLLSETGAVDLQDNDGITPLMRAAQNGHEAAVEALLSAGASVTVTDELGRNALKFAEPHPDVFALLQTQE